MTKPILSGQQRKIIAREVLRKSGAYLSDNPVAIFMAGLPGSGKTEQTKGLMQQMIERPLRIDMDEIAELIQGYSPQKAHLFRLDATAVLEKLFDEAKKRKYWFIMDGTFSGQKALQNVMRCHKEGYSVQILYIHQEPSVAWEYTKAREIVEKRAIDKEGFISSYYETRDNLRNAQKLQYVNISVIVKDEDNNPTLFLSEVRDIDATIGPILTKDVLESMLK